MGTTDLALPAMRIDTPVRSKQPAILAAFAALIVTLCTASWKESANNYELLAQAFLHGHVFIEWPGNWIDAVPYRGQHYVIEGPLPAILLVPFIAVFGSGDRGTTQMILTALLCSAAIYWCWILLERIGASRSSAAWLTAFFFAGTQFWWVARLGGDVWFTAHIATVAFVFAALAEVTGRGRGWLVALWVSAAVFSRFTLVLSIPILALLVLQKSDRSERSRELIGFSLVCLAAAVAWIGYNEIRWSEWYDIGYTTWYRLDPQGSPTGSPFGLQHFGYQLRSFFVQGPSFQSTFPFVRFDLSGVALTWTSPALVLALAARQPRNLVAAFWIAALLTAGPSFLYYVNGYAQFGMRHALDFEPFLLALMALAFPTRLPLIGKALIAWSILVGIWGVWYTAAIASLR